MLLDTLDYLQTQVPIKHVEFHVKSSTIDIHEAQNNLYTTFNQFQS
jgi:hypothetical protein